MTLFVYICPPKIPYASLPLGDRREGDDIFCPLLFSTYGRKKPQKSADTILIVCTYPSILRLALPARTPLSSSSSFASYVVGYVGTTGGGGQVKSNGASEYE